MSDESADPTDEQGSDDGVPEEARNDPDRIDKEEKYEDRHEEARETANPDDHRDEEPHRS